MSPMARTNVDCPLNGAQSRTNIAKMISADRKLLLDVDEAEFSAASGPPSPPSASSGTTTPRLTIAPCPARLRLTTPPMNYGAVEAGFIYRSAFPYERNITFLSSLKVRSVLTLVDTEISVGVQKWMSDNSIEQSRVLIATNKEGNTINTTLDSLSNAILFAMDKVNQPVWIHCNQGKHRTGCVVACLRRMQGLSINEAIDEYRTYASRKAREGDIALIKAFDPLEMLMLAVRSGLLDEMRFAWARDVCSASNTERVSTLLAHAMSRTDSASRAPCLFRSDRRDATSAPPASTG